MSRARIETEDITCYLVMYNRAGNVIAMCAITGDEDLSIGMYLQAADVWDFFSIYPADCQYIPMTTGPLPATYSNFEEWRNLRDR